MKNKKLLFLASAVAPACFAPALHAAGAGEQKPQKPNILLICADDLGWSDIGCYGVNDR